MVESVKLEKKTDYSGIASLLKWGVISIATVGVVGGGGYLLVKHVLKEGKKDKENSETLAVDSKGKTTVTTIGAGKTPPAYASLIDSALKRTNWAGIPDTNEDAIYEYLKELKSQYEVALISKSYENLFSKTLNEALKGDLDDDEYSACIKIVTSKPVK